MSGDVILKDVLVSLFDSGQALVSLRDTEGRVVRVNQAVASLHAATPDDIAGRSLFDLYGSAATRICEDDRTVARSGLPMLSTVERLPVGAGRTRSVAVSKLPLCDEHGVVTGILVVGNDISGTGEPPYAREDGQGLLETVINCLTGAVAYYGPDRRLAFANREYWDVHDYMGTRDVARIGARFEDITRATCERAIECESDAARQALIDQFLDDFSDPQAGTVVKQKERWYRHHRYRMPCGGRATFAYDVSEAKKAEQAAVESRKLLETLVESLSEALVLYGPDRRLQFGNSTYWRFHEEAGTADVIRVGATIEENAGAMVARLAERDTAFDARAAMEEIDRVHGGEAAAAEFRWGRRDVRLRHYPTPDGGRVTLGHDVTERKKAEAALETSNARLRDFAVSASDWFWEMDADLRYTWVSARIADATGEPAENVHGRKRSDLIDTTVDPEAWAAHQETVRQRKPFRDFVYRRRSASLPDGLDPVLWVKTSGVPVFSADGTFRGYRGTGSNVTPEKLAEQELKDSERRYQTLSETAPVGIFRTTVEGICTYHNGVWAAIAGLDGRAGLDAPWTSVFDPKDRRGIDAAWREAALKDGVYRTEARISDGRGGETWVLATIALEESRDGAPHTFVGTLTDISQLKHAEAELHAAQDALREHRDELEVLVERRTAALRAAQQSLIAKERLSAIGQLTATVSHELRNPLGTISASFTALRQRLDLPNDKAVSIAERIERNIGRCETIIQDLLNYTRIDTLRCVPLDLDAWLMRFLAEHEPPDGIIREVCLDAGGRVCIDRMRLGQALTNLIRNATDALMEDASTGGRLEIESGRRDGACLIWIRDDGPGIDPDVMGRIFEPLVSTKAFGVGLGLPLVRQIIELHGGTIDIENRQGRGVEAVVRLPLHDSTNPPHPDECMPARRRQDRTEP